MCAALRARSLGLKSDDLSWDYAIAAIWGNVELGLGIIAANMVLLRSYMSFFRGKAGTTSSHTAASHEHHNNHAYSFTRVGWRKQSEPERDPETWLDSRSDVDSESQKHLTRINEIKTGTQEYHAK